VDSSVIIPPQPTMPPSFFSPRVAPLSSLTASYTTFVPSCGRRSE
jgi:hypothetical protein